MIWNKLTQLQKDNIYKQYKEIAQQIQKVNSEKANKSKSHTFTENEQIIYNETIKNLQNKYDDICSDYECDFCNRIFKLDLYKMKQLFKGDTKPIFCCRNCSGKYYADKQRSRRNL